MNAMHILSAVELCYLKTILFRPQKKTAFVLILSVQR